MREPSGEMLGPLTAAGPMTVASAEGVPERTTNRSLAASLCRKATTASSSAAATGSGNAAMRTSIEVVNTDTPRTAVRTRAVVLNGVGMPIKGSSIVTRLGEEIVDADSC
jgi:hypothetical protein